MILVDKRHRRISGDRGDSQTRRTATRRASVTRRPVRRTYGLQGLQDCIRDTGVPDMRRAEGATGGMTPGADAPESASPDLAAIERDVVRRWAEADVPGRSMTRTPQGPWWSCCQQPHSASGMPGVHLLPGLAITDIYQRFKAMQGFRVLRRRSWNCHGLAVEVAVERELGLRGKAEIEAYAPDRFIARCRESVRRHVEAMSAAAARMGCWADDDAASYASDANSVESAWRSLRRAYDAGLLVRDDRVGPYCPRCRTPLDVRDLGRPGAPGSRTGTAVIVRLPIATLPGGANPRLRGAGLLAEATAPWTLAANVAVAVHPHATYALARKAGKDDQVIVAEARLAEVLGDGWRVAARVAGAELAGASYLPPLDGVAPSRSRPVIASYRVAADSGTGLAHLAPAYSADDLTACLAHGLDVPDPLGEDGCFGDGLPVTPGTFFADADPLVIGMLADRGALFHARPREDRDQRCIQCGTPVLFRALRAWRLRSAGPGTQAGWTLSRTRYWGTPLPLWECPRGHVTCAGSLAELSGLAGRDLTGLDPHRPYVDAVTITCPRCGAAGRRVPEVIDDGYDAAALPFAPPTGADQAAAASPDHGGPLPADAPLVIARADDGDEWLSALQTVAALSGRRPVSGQALRLWPVLDEAGRPMSRSLGNVVAPLPLIDRHGADAARWHFAAGTPASAAGAVPDAALAAISATVLRDFWDAAEHLVRYAAENPARADRWRPGDAATPPPGARPPADRWMLSQLQRLVSDVTDALERFDTSAATARLAAFTKTLSGRYLASCRDRLAQLDDTAGHRAALATLHECVEVLTRLMAPIAPFLTDHVWSLIGSWRPGAPDSVHLADWPGHDQSVS